MLGRHLLSLTLCASLAFGLAGCGGDDSGPPPSYTTQISSDPAYDGDIADIGSNTFSVTQGMSTDVQSVFAGIDPASLYEYRAFLDFPLSGPSGVPGDAIIEAAYLDIYVNSFQTSAGSLPLRIELVAFQPPNLLPTDYDLTEQPALAYIQVNPPISAADAGTNVSIDVTSLMVRAQRLGLKDLQLRIMEDLGPAVPALMEINDSTGSDRATRAPLLTVTFE